MGQLPDKDMAQPEYGKYDPNAYYGQEGKK